MQLTLNIEVHTQENNPISREFLNEHKEKFAHDTYMVLCVLVSGRKLDYKTALVDGLTGDLRRRVKDLRDMGIPVSDEWVTTTNERKFKRWFMTDEDRIIALNTLLNRFSVVS